MKRVLLIHPNNILLGGQGENNRVISIIKLLKKTGYSIDLLSFQNFTSDSSFDNFEELNKNELISNVFIYDFNDENKNRINFSNIKRLFKKVKSKIFQKYYPLQSWVKPDAQILFNQILKDNVYDAIGMFYTYLADFFINSTIEIESKKIYFMEDSMFLQQYYWCEKNDPKNNIGYLMAEELKRMECFDEFLCISYDEKLFYEKLTNKKMYFFPHLILDEAKKNTNPSSEKKWDVFYVGFNNPYNTEGLEWFVDKVYPHLDKDLNILLGGSATKVLDSKSLPKNIITKTYVENLDETYKTSKISICPMFRGTGMKIKVIEAMAMDIPVVCNERGVDGFPDKFFNGCLVTQDPKEFADYINKLAKDDFFYNSVAQKSKNYFNKVFDISQYEKLLSDIIER